MHLTDTQRRLLEFLRQHIDVHGYPPSQMEIAKAFGFSQNRFDCAADGCPGSGPPGSSMPSPAAGFLHSTPP